MKFSFVSLFPDLCTQVMSTGVIGKAVDQGLIEVQTSNPRDHAVNRYGSVDDTPYGGGPGMVMRPEPLVAAVEDLQLKEEALLVMMTPTGKPFEQAMAKEWSTKPQVAFICGRYEGMDERVKEVLNPVEVSLGDFVLSGGELAALSMADATGRLIPGVLGDESSTVEESFNLGLEYPQYTKPRSFRGKEVPEVLLSGHHQAIEDWRREQSRSITEQRRPDLLNSGNFSAVS
jgi:tRNA (guanine37-N1)-methyltransferase